MRHRTALITAGSIAAVVFAGAIAVGANLGILTVADSSPVGELTTATVAQQSPVEPAQAYAAAKPAGAVGQRATQKYVIKKAGSVRIAFSKTAVRFVDAAAERHWTWKLAQAGDRHEAHRDLRARLGHARVRGSDRQGREALGQGRSPGHRGDSFLLERGACSIWVSTAPPVPSSAGPASSSGGGGEGGSHDGGGEDD